MAEISDIVLRIRVDIVNNKAIAGLVNNLAAATSAVRTNSRATAVASASATRAVSAAQKVEAARANQQIKVAAAQQRLEERIAAAKQKFEQRIARSLEKSAAAQKRTEERLAAARIRIDNQIRRSAEQSAAAQARAVTTAARAREAAARSATRAQETARKASERAAAAEVRAAAAVTRAAERAAAAQQRAADKVARAQEKVARAAQALFDKNKKLYSISSLLGQAQAKLGAAVNKVIDPLSRVERKMDAVFRAGVHMQSMGRDLLGFGKKVVNFLKNAVSAWGDFEFNVNRAAGAMDVFDNKSDIYKRLKDGIISMSRELRLVPAEEAAKAMYYWQSTTGQTIDTAAKLELALEGVSTALKVATLTQADQETVIKGAYSIMRQYKLSLKDVPQILKDLFVVTQRTSLEYTDLIQSFKFTGPVARMLGSDYQKVAKWLGMIGDLGQRGSMSGRGLSMMFTQIVRPTDKAKSAYNKLFEAQLGVKNGYNKLVFPKGKFVGFEKLITTLAKSMHGLTMQQKLNYLTTVTGTQNSARIVLPLIDAQIDAIRKGNNIFAEGKYSLAGSAKVFDKAWGLLSDSWNGTVGLLKQTVMPILLILGENIAKVLTPILDDLSKALWDAKPAFEEVAKSVTESFAPALQWLGDLMKKAIGWFKQNPKIVKAMAKWGTIATVVSLVAGAFLLLAGTVSLLFANLIIVVLGATPLIAMFIAIGVVVAGLAIGFYRNVGGIQEAWSRFVSAIVKAFNLFVNGSKDASVSVTDLTDAFKAMSDWVTTNVAGVLNKISEALENLTPEQVQTIKDIVKALIGLKLLNTGLGITIGVIKSLTGNIMLMTSAMKSAIPIISGFLGVFSKKNIMAAVTNMRNLVTAIVLGIKAIGVAIVSNPVGAIIMAIIVGIGLLVAAYETNFMGFKDFVDGIIAWFIANVVPVIKNIIQTVGPVVEQIVKAVGDFIGTVVKALGDFINWIGPIISTLVTNLQTGWAALVAGIEGVIGWFANLPTSIQTFIGEVITNIQNFVQSVIDTVVGFLTNLANNWDYYLGYILGVIIAFPILAISEIIKFGQDLIGNIETALSTMWNSFVSWFGQTLITLVSWFVTTLPKVAQGAADLFNGIIDWISKLPGRIAEFFGQVWSNISGWFATNIPLIAAEAGRLIGDIAEWFQKLPGRVAEFFGQVWTNISGWFTTNAPIIAASAEDLVQGVIDWFIGLPGRIITGIGDLGDKLKIIFGQMVAKGSTFMAEILRVGAAIIAGIWKGIEDMKQWFFDKVFGFFNGIVDGVKDILGMASPSKVFAGIGTQMVNGLAVGISTTDSAMAAMTGVLTDVTSAATGAQLALAASGGTFSQSLTQDTTKTIELKVDVTSADGSVNSMDMNTLAELITSSDMTRTLERMSTVE